MEEVCVVFVWICVGCGDVLSEDGGDLKGVEIEV